MRIGSRTGGRRSERYTDSELQCPHSDPSGVRAGDAEKGFAHAKHRLDGRRCFTVAAVQKPATGICRVAGASQSVTVTVR